MGLSNILRSAVGRLAGGAGGTTRRGGGRSSYGRGMGRSSYGRGMGRSGYGRGAGGRSGSGGVERLLRSFLNRR